jgi:hypothetical protein
MLCYKWSPLPTLNGYQGIGKKRRTRKIHNQLRIRANDNKKRRCTP